MRSRFCAYALGDVDYILSSWHPSTRPERIDLDEAQRWIRLKIVATTEDNVEFIATYKLGGKAGRLHERSRFRFEDGRWFYLDGELRDT